MARAVDMMAAMDDLLRTYTLSLAALLATLAVLKLGSGLLIPLAIAGVIWFLIEALARVIGRAVRAPMWVRTLAATFLMLAALIGVVEIVRENVAGVIESVPDYERRIEAALRSIDETVPFSLPNSIPTLLEASNLQAWFRDFAAAFASFLGNMGLVLAFVLFIYISQQTFPERLRRAFSDTSRLRHARRVLNRIQQQVRSYLWAKTLMSLLTAVICGIVLWIAGLNYWLFWALWIFLLNFVPYIGSAMGVLLPTLLALVQFTNPVVIAVVFTLLTITQVTIDNLVEPQVMGKTLNIDPLVVMIALVLWGSLWGMVGVFLAIPLTAIAIFIFYQFPGTRWLAILLSQDGDLEGAMSED
ncbi:hypothetical protein CCR85_01570 [Rhodothalassium salexigens]|nr:hypothetical protein [Rhodothalassium salexigens]MBK5920824.1 hypothetical protein [Rhodothalassium salexigens]